MCWCCVRKSVYESIRWNEEPGTVTSNPEIMAKWEKVLGSELADSVIYRDFLGKNHVGNPEHCVLVKTFGNP